MDDFQAKAINLTTSTYKLAEKQNLFIKVHGSDESRLETINKIMEITSKNQGSNPQFALNKLEAETLWNLRKKALLATNQLKSNCKIYITDVCVPISKLGTSVKEAKRLLNEYSKPHYFIHFKELSSANI
jgi:D-lactate dehydrogenase (cytochrome)